MPEFINDNFLLDTLSARNLFHNYVSELPIIDYHCHLSPMDIAKDRKFNNITEAWLENDHYKWRLMRANGIQEKYCSGDAPARAKFIKWAETIPHAIGNPVYHWTHLELKRYFNVDILLSPSTADEIWERANEQLAASGYTVQDLLRKFKVEVICTTDDPVDNLEYHIKIKGKDPGFKVLPGFRPDKAFNINDNRSFNKYIDRRADITSSDIDSYDHLLLALARRVEYFSRQGCKISDHSFPTLLATLKVYSRRWAVEEDFRGALHIVVGHYDRRFNIGHFEEAKPTWQSPSPEADRLISKDHLSGTSESWIHPISN